MKELISKIVFVMVQMVIFYFSIFTDALYLNEIRYLSILLSFLFAFFYFNSRTLWRYGRHFLIRGLLFTVLADYFLVVAGEQYELGVLLFIIAQYSYFLYLSADVEILQRIRQFGIRMGIGMFISGMGYFYCGKLVAIAVLASIYAAFLLSNLYTVYRKIKDNVLFAIGLTLLVLCDISLVLSRAYMLNMPAGFSDKLRLLVWVFYIPSQVLISLASCQKVLEND